MERSKKTTSKGGITIPKDMRAMTGITESKAVNVSIVNGNILIKKHIASCNVCDATQNIVDIKGYTICRDCLKKALEE